MYGPARARPDLEPLPRPHRAAVRARRGSSEFAAALEGWEWDVALLQEVPPWWPPALAARRGRAVAHAAHLAQLAAAAAARDLRRATRTSSSRAAAAANAILVRGRDDPRAPRRAAAAAARGALGARRAARGRGWVVNVHSHNHPERARAAPTREAAIAARARLGGRRAADLRRRHQPAPARVPRARARRRQPRRPHVHATAARPRARREVLDRGAPVRPPAGGRDAGLIECRAMRMRRPARRARSWPRSPPAAATTAAAARRARRPRPARAAPSRSRWSTSSSTRRTATASVGQQVCWVNEDTIDHNAVAESGAEFKSELFGKGETFTATVDAPGDRPVRLHGAPRDDGGTLTVESG